MSHPEALYFNNNSNATAHQYSHELDIARDDKATAVTPSNQPKLLCGLRRKIVIGLIIVIVLLAAIIGGAVGGVLSHRHKSVSPKVKCF